MHLTETKEIVPDVLIFQFAEKSLESHLGLPKLEEINSGKHSRRLIMLLRRSEK